MLYSALAVVLGNTNGLNPLSPSQLGQWFCFQESSHFWPPASLPLVTGHTLLTAILLEGQATVPTVNR